MSFRLRSRPDAFSLIEIVLAIGIISFALVGIIGLFPVALNTANASQQETHAALIARTIFNDLSSRPGDRTVLLQQPSLEDAPSTIDVDLATEAEYFLAFDRDGRALPDKITAAIFESGTSGTANFLVKVAVTLPEPTATGPPPVEGVSRVDVTITSPAAAPLENRPPLSFVSLLRQK